MSKICTFVKNGANCEIWPPPGSHTITKYMKAQTQCNNDTHKRLQKLNQGFKSLCYEFKTSVTY